MSNDPRILIIEDHDVLRMMLFTVLRHQPLAVDTAVSAEEAIEKIASCDYALILIDMGMAGRQAETFLQEFKNTKPDAPTFVLAVRDHTGDTVADPDVVSAVVNKPLEVDTLAQLVRECAIVVPTPETAESGECPPAESEVRRQMDRSDSFVN